MAALMWISHAERPLNPDELLYALAIEIGSPDLNSDNILSTGTLLACCQGLIVIDKEASTVRLIHFTLQEYLRAHPQLFGTAHSTIAETCLSYLNSRQIMALSAGPFPDLQDTPFLEYSSLYWGIHAKRDLSEGAKLLALKLFGGYGSHISTKILMKANGWYYPGLDSKPTLLSGLHCASAFGIDEIVAGLAEVEGCDIDQGDDFGHTPLMWAAGGGNEGVVEILLGRYYANPNKRSLYGETPLWCAAESGREGVVKILLGRDDVNPEAPGLFGQTPLCCAAKGGHEGVVKVLLGRGGVNPNFGDVETPLSSAALNGHEGVVKILLGQDDINPEKPDGVGQTPLCCAASRGHEGVVKLLLERGDVNPDHPAPDGGTPLGCAANHGYEGVVKLLLERDDVNPNKPDNGGQTPLSRAVQSGHAGVVALLQPLASTTPSPTPEQQATVPLTPSDYRYNSPRATSTRTTPTPQTRPLRPSPPSYSSRRTSSRISKGRPR